MKIWFAVAVLDDRHRLHLRAGGSAPTALIRTDTRLAGCRKMVAGMDRSPAMARHWPPPPP